MSFQGVQDASHPETIYRHVRVFWSRARLWHGGKVFVQVRTENVPDGTKVDVVITPEGRDDDVIETLADLDVQGNQVDQEHEINWQDKNMLQVTDRKFHLKASLKFDKPIESDLSQPLYVDREPPSFSL